jgi:hypothetical protein
MHQISRNPLQGRIFGKQSQTYIQRGLRMAIRESLLLLEGGGEKRRREEYQHQMREHI